MSEVKEVLTGEEQTGEGLSGALAALELKLAEVQRDIKRLKSYVRGLEEENQRLRALIAETMASPPGQDRLRLLYEQGYHICPAQFARVRGSQGCLFCLSFLEKRG
ncbi:MAG: initiation control protein YabA [Moorellaceae bacterium]